MTKKTRPCGACCNFAPAVDPPTLGYCWAGPSPWRNARSLVHGCKARGVPHKRWTPEKQWHFPGDHHEGDDHERTPTGPL